MQLCVLLCFHGLVCGIPRKASARSWETDSGQARYWFNEFGRCIPSQLVVVMDDRRDWGGGGDDPGESTQRMIERIWESLTEIQMRMDQQAPVPPVVGEAVPVAPVPPPPGVEVPFVAPVPPSPPVVAAEELVVLVERFLRLQLPTYTGGPNPDTAEHWIHEIERVFMTMKCLAVDRVVLATFQLRGFVQEWWRLKMQTTFAGRIEVGKKGSVQDLAARWDFGSRISDAVHGTEQLKKQPREQLLLREQFGLVRWASQVRVVSGSPNSQLVKEEDGEVVSKFSRVVVSWRWKNRSKVPPGSQSFHQAIGVLIAISRGI
ncbi:hypothetical protein Taro_006947 [Colocasia esculenta]|uniref:Retrotransposon gag domain-containing protein n=1 Tax=Colocasia esculenta TaxID=4460 RepID=A0A843TYV0_COLES|nr:hypothetical protein [Colocasia esculenta]